MLNLYIGSLILTIAFIFLLWHLDVNHNLDRLGEKRTRGVFKISPETAYRLSLYGLIVIIFIFNLLIIYVRQFS